MEGREQNLKDVGTSFARGWLQGVADGNLRVGKGLNTLLDPFVNWTFKHPLHPRGGTGPASLLCVMQDDHAALYAQGLRLRDVHCIACAANTDHDTTFCLMQLHFTKQDGLWQPLAFAAEDLVLYQVGMTAMHHA